MIFRPELHLSIASRRRRRVPQVRRRHRSGAHFGMVVGAASAFAFLAVFYSNHIPTVAKGIVSASRNIGRENAPPAGAYYSGCDEAREAGVAPIYAGEPGYRNEMDGDSDGVACEPYRRGW